MNMSRDEDKLIRQLSLLSFLLSRQRPFTAREVQGDAPVAAGSGPPFQTQGVRRTDEMIRADENPPVVLFQSARGDDVGSTVGGGTGRRGGWVLRGACS